MKRTTRKYESKTTFRLKSERLIQWRIDNKLTQQKAAKRAGVSLPTYQNAEYGRALQLVKASKIAEAVKVPLAELEMKSA